MTSEMQFLTASASSAVASPLPPSTRLLRLSIAAVLMVVRVRRSELIWVWFSFCLGCSYAMDVNMERADDVLTHKRLLEQSFEALNLRAVEVVIDPIQSVKGKVVIDALPERRPRQVELRRDCPYLGTVNRQVLDFDFEKFCSISLSNLNVYACLVCGKYYQGRGLKSHAYTHSLEAGQHVFINLQTEKVYCLPDGYEINDPSLEDI
ncbi:hypothetical protein ABZP36_010250 [Zizania latifolia]